VPVTMLWTSLNRFLDPLRPRRQAVVLLGDAFLILLAWHTTYLFRLGVERWLHERPSYDWGVLLGVIVVYSVVSWALGVPRASWRYTGFHDITRLAWVCLGAGLASAVVVLMAQLVEVPRAVLALHPVFTLVMMSLGRMTIRMLSESSRARRSGGQPGGQRALVLGAGAAAKLLIAGIQHRGWTVVGLLDDNVSKHGSRIAGLTVWGGLELLKEPGTLDDVTHLVLAMPSATQEQRQRAIDLATETGLPVVTVPSADELREGARASTACATSNPKTCWAASPSSSMKAPCRPSSAGRPCWSTAPGARSGSELCRQIARFGPSRLCCSSSAITDCP